MVSDCVFCRIVSGDESAQIVRRWSGAVAFIPLNPVTPGHVLVVPAQHVEDALENPYVTAQAVAYAVELAEGPCNIITSVGVEATQSIKHLHWHIVPRHAGDGLALPWTGQNENGADHE